MTAPSSPRPRLRSSLQGIPSYKPGRPAAPAQDRPTYKLSSNENPYPPPPELQEAIQRAARATNRYPDLACTRLVAELSDRLGIPASHIAPGTGSVALLYHLLQATCEPGDEVVYAWRSFEAYPIGAQVAGATSVRVPLTVDARHDLDAMAAADHRSHQGRPDLYAEQPDRPGRRPRGARGILRPRTRRRAHRDRRGLPAVRPRS